MRTLLCFLALGFALAGSANAAAEQIAYTVDIAEIEPYVGGKLVKYRVEQIAPSGSPGSVEPYVLHRCFSPTGEKIHEEIGDNITAWKQRSALYGNFSIPSAKPIVRCEAYTWLPKTGNGVPRSTVLSYVI